MPALHRRSAGSGALLEVGKLCQTGGRDGSVWIPGVLSGLIPA